MYTIVRDSTSLTPSLCYFYCYFCIGRLLLVVIISRDGSGVALVEFVVTQLTVSTALGTNRKTLEALPQAVTTWQSRRPLPVGSVRRSRIDGQPVGPQQPYLHPKQNRESKRHMMRNLPRSAFTALDHARQKRRHRWSILLVDRRNRYNTEICSCLSLFLFGKHEPRYGASKRIDRRGNDFNFERCRFLYGEQESRRIGAEHLSFGLGRIERLGAELILERLLPLTTRCDAFDARRRA